LQQFPAGAGHIHVNGVQLLHRGQGRGLIHRHQGPLGDAGLADTPGHRGQHPGIAQVDVGLLQGRPIGLHRGHRRFGRRRRVIVFLLPHRLHGQQLLITLRFEAQGGEIGFGLGQIGLGAIVGRPVGGRIDLVQGLAFPHVRPFGELALEDNAPHLGPDFRHLISGGPAR